MLGKRFFILSLVLLGLVGFVNVFAGDTAGTLADDTFIDDGLTHDFADGDSANKRAYIAGTAQMPVAGTVYVDLYGGQFNDLLFAADSKLSLSNDLIITGSMMVENSVTSTIYDDKCFTPATIFFQKGQTFGGDDSTTELLIQNDVILDFQGNDCEVGSAFTFSVDADSSLVIKDAVVKGSYDGWLAANASGTITFENVVFENDPYSSGIDGTLVYDGVNNAFNGGLTLGADTTFESMYPIKNGNLDINGYNLTLASDLLLGEGVTLDMTNDSNFSGTILPVSHEIYLSADNALTGTLYFSGSDLTIDGDDAIFTLNSGAAVDLNSTYTLYVQNTTLSGLYDGWMTAESDNGTVVFTNVYFEADPYSDPANGGTYFVTYEGDRNVFAGGLKLSSDQSIDFGSEPLGVYLDLNGYTLTLESNLTLQADTAIIGDGDGGTEPGIAATADTYSIFLTSGHTIDSVVRLYNSITLNGNYATLSVASGSGFEIVADKTITFKNIVLSLAASGTSVVTGDGSYVIGFGTSIVRGYTGC